MMCIQSGETQPKVSVSLYGLDIEEGSEDEWDAQDLPLTPFRWMEGKKVQMETIKAVWQGNSNYIFLMPFHVCFRKPTWKRSSPDFQSHLPSFWNSMGLTLIINMDSRALKLRALFFLLHWNNCWKAQVSAFNAVDLEASGSGLRGFVSLCGCGGEEAGRVIYLFDFVNRSCKAIWNIHAELSEKPVSVLFTAQ